MRRNVPHHTHYDTWGKNYFNEKVIAIKRMQKTFLELLCLNNSNVKTPVDMKWSNEKWIEDPEHILLLGENNVVNNFYNSVRKIIKMMVDCYAWQVRNTNILSQSSYLLEQIKL